MKRGIGTILAILTLQALLPMALSLADTAVDDPTIRMPTDSADVEEMVEGIVLRPWKCCDLAICLLSNPPICTCLDKVKKCSLTCKKCQMVSISPILYQCKDSYRGNPGRTCKKTDGEYVAGSNSVSTDIYAEELVEEIAEEMQTSTTTRTGRVDLGKRPWECCDRGICKLSYPPVCICTDKVKKCSPNCKKCKLVSTFPILHQCQDWYRGSPGPMCTKPDEKYVLHGN